MSTTLPPLPAAPPPVPPVRQWGAQRPAASTDARSGKHRQERQADPDGCHMPCGLAGLAMPADPHQGEDSGDGADSGGSDGGGRQAHTSEPEPLAMDARVRHVGDAIAMVCRFEQAQCVWSARVPLDRALLPDTVLHMAYSPGLLALRFDTSDFDVRELLTGHVASLEALVEGLLPAGCSAAVSL